MAGLEVLALCDYSLAIKAGVHFTLCGGTICKLGTAKHHEKYLPGLDSLELPGCFGMTELGHGSNVLGIETQVRRCPWFSHIHCWGLLSVQAHPADNCDVKHSLAGFPKAMLGSALARVLGEGFVVDSLLCTCTVEAVSGIRGGIAEAEGRGSIRGCLRSREWLCRGGYLVYSAGYVICTGIFAQYEYLLHSRISIGYPVFPGLCAQGSPLCSGLLCSQCIYVEGATFDRQHLTMTLCGLALQMDAGKYVYADARLPAHMGSKSGEDIFKCAGKSNHLAASCHFQIASLTHWQASLYIVGPCRGFTSTGLLLCRRSTTKRLGSLSSTHPQTQPQSSGSAAQPSTARSAQSLPN